MIEFTSSKFLVEAFLLLCLILLSAIDIKKRSLPSPLTTSIIFVLALVNFQNITFGILSAIFGWLMMEGITEDGAFYSGLADLKVTIMLGLTIHALGMFMIMVVLILVYGVVYKALMVSVFKQKGETAFIPTFLFVFITLKLIEVYNGVWI